MADDDDGREIGTERRLIIMLHVLDRERLDAVRRCLAPRRVVLRKQRDGQRVAGNVAGAFDFAGDGRGELLLDDFEIVFGQRRRKFIVCEQLHAAFKLVGQNLKRKIAPADSFAPTVRVH